MKNIIKIFLASNILAFGSVDLTAADATVSSSGNWSESSTWGGSYPGSAVDTLNFTQGGLELVVDSNASAKQILLYDDDGYTNNASIVINQGVSFNIGGISPAKGRGQSRAKRRQLENHPHFQRGRDPKHFFAAKLVFFIRQIYF